MEPVFGNSSSCSKDDSILKPVSTDFLEKLNEEYDCEFVVIKCKNDEKVSIPIALALQSGVLKNMLDVGFACQVIPLTSLPASLLEMIMEYWKLHVEGTGSDEERLKDIHNRKTDFFTRTGPDALYDLLEAAHYLDASELLERGTDHVAELIKKMKVDEIQAYFGIMSDFTPEEEAQLNKDFPWADEEIC